MDIYIDDNQVSVDGESLSEVILTAQYKIEDKSRLVVEIIMNDEVLTQDQITALHDQKITTEAIRLITAKPSELALTALNDTQVNLEELQTIQSQVAEKLQTDQAGDALNDMQVVLHTWQNSQLAVNHASELMDVDIEELQTTSGSAVSIINDLADKLNAMQDYLQDKDFVALADLLGYELNDTAKQWIEMIDSLCESITQRNNI